MVNRPCYGNTTMIKIAFQPVSNAILTKECKFATDLNIQISTKEYMANSSDRSGTIDNLKAITYFEPGKKGQTQLYSGPEPSSSTVISNPPKNTLKKFHNAGIEVLKLTRLSAGTPVYIVIKQIKYMTAFPIDENEAGTFIELNSRHIVPVREDIMKVFRDAFQAARTVPLINSLAHPNDTVNPVDIPQRQRRGGMRRVEGNKLDLLRVLAT